MPNSFPPGRGPAWYGSLTAASYKGIFTLGTNPSFTLAGHQTGGNMPTAYAVRDFYGNLISSGSISTSTVTPATPTGGWVCGWYRLYITGPNTDATFGNAYGNYSFCIIRSNGNFVPPPAANTGPVILDDSSTHDPYSRGIAVLGPDRWKVGDAANLAGAIPSLNGPAGGGTVNVQTAIGIEKNYNTASGYTDTARPRSLLFSFGNGAVDRLTMLDGNGNETWVAYCKDGTLDGAQVFVKISAGTLAGTAKVQVYYPNNTTLVETFDSIPATPANYPYSIVNRVTQASNYVRIVERGRYTIAAPTGPSAIDLGRRAGCRTVVQTLYPDVQWFEGPENEPDQLGWSPEEAAQATAVFYGNVKAANANAKVLGPNPVSAGIAYAAPGAWWDKFFAAGGGNYLDGISFHAYNMLLGDLSMMRTNLTAFQTMLTRWGVQNKPRWQTEQGVFICIYGVYHPRRVRWVMLQFLVQEQFGIPKEQNHYWYDEMSGFWSQPAQFSNGQAGVHPQVPVIRTFSEEVFGRTLETALDFGTPGNNMYVGSVYKNASDNTRVVVLMNPSPIEGAQVVFNVTGATGSLTTSDCFGNLGSVTISGGKVTVPTTDMPTYLRLPAGATVTVSSYGSWPALTSARLGENLAITCTSLQAASNGTPTHLANGVWDNGYDTTYDPTTSAPTPPGWYQLQWPQGVRFDRVVIWSGQCWQTKAGFVDFDVQTSNDGSTWTTRVTKNYPPPATVPFVCNDLQSGTSFETFWDERWIFDLKLPSVVTAKYLRLYVRATSYGGEPDATCLAQGGQGGPQAVVVQEIGVYNSEFASPQSVSAPSA